MGNNQSNHFPHIPENVTWSLNTIINGKSQTLLSDFFFEGRGGCTQATRSRDRDVLTRDLAVNYKYLWKAVRCRSLAVI